MQRALAKRDANGPQIGRNTHKFVSNSYEIRTNFTETCVFTHLPRHSFVPISSVFVQFVNKASKHTEMHKGHTLQSHGQVIDHAPAFVRLVGHQVGAVLPRCHNVVGRTGGATP